MSQKKVVLLACGSFNPPTYLHLRMFEVARDQIHSLGLGHVVGGIISPVHDAYGKKDLAPAHHRIAMLKLALRSSSWLKLSEWETQQKGWTRTLQVLQHHQNTLNKYLETDMNNPPSWIPENLVYNVDEPDNANISDQYNGNRNRQKITVKLLCGGDLLESFAKPGLWADEDIEQIVGGHGLVVMTRAGSDPQQFIYETELLYKYRRNIMILTEHIVNEVSSTALRRLIRRNESAKYLTDDAVLDYIKLNGLYGATDTTPEYNIFNDIIHTYGKRSPQDITMLSPEESSFKNILISIRDKPTADETVIIKKPRKSNYLMPSSRTDLVVPLQGITPKVAYVDKVSSTYVPGKAVKIISDGMQHTLEDEKVSEKNEYSSLDSYLNTTKDEIEYDLYKRRVSEGNVNNNAVDTPDNVIKKRCSSTIRKLRPEDMKKSKSEVSKLCDKVKSMKLKEKEKDGRNYKTRSCNDIVRLILTKHGIHVISDTEAIV